MNLTLHYDHACGLNPLWRRSIQRSLEGDHTAVRSEYARLAAYSPAAARLLEASLGYADSGQQVYYLGARMQELLGATDLNKVPREFLRLPYPCFYVALEDCPLPIWGGARTLWHQVSGVYVVERTHRFFTLVFWGKENERSEMVGDDATFWMDVDLNKAPTVSEGVVDIDTYIRGLLSDPTLDSSDIGIERLQDGERKDEARGIHNKSILSLTRTVVNLVLYLNSRDPEQVPVSDPRDRDKLKKKLRGLKSSSKRARIQRKIERLPTAHIVWIGKGVERQHSQGGKASTGAGRAVRQHMRRGHWHSYWTGPRKDEEGNHRKGTEQLLRWVSPTLVGKDRTGILRAQGTVRRFREDRAT